MWRSDFFCMTPEQNHHHTAGMSYFAVHTTFLLAFFSLLSEWIPLDHVSWFALYQGLSFGTLAFSIFYIGQAFYWRPGWSWVITWTLLPLAFAHCGLALAIADYPHHEVAACGLGILFFASLAERKLRQATLFFVLALLVREDVGFHLAAILGLHVCYRWIVLRTQWSQLKYEWTFLFLAITSSSLALGFQSYGFPVGNTFFRTYVGSGEVSAFERVSQNFSRFLEKRSYLWAPWLATLLWSGFRRDLGLALALFAYLPWALLNFHGTREEAGSLFAYYGYPFLFSFAWVLLSLPWRGRPASPGAPFALLAICGVSLIGFGQHRVKNFFQNALPKAEFHHGREGTKVLKELQLSDSQNPDLRFDGATLSLGEGLIPKNSWVATCPTKRPPDLMLFWRNSFDVGHINRELLSLPKCEVWEVLGTPLRLVHGSNFRLPKSVQARLQPFPRLGASHQSIGARSLPGGHFEMQCGENSTRQLLLPLAGLPPGRLSIRYDLQCRRLDSEDKSFKFFWSTQTETPAAQVPLTLASTAMTLILEIPNQEKERKGILMPPPQCHITLVDCHFSWKPLQEP